MFLFPPPLRKKKQSIFFFEKLLFCYERIYSNIVVEFISLPKPPFQECQNQPILRVCSADDRVTWNWTTEISLMNISNY